MPESFSALKRALKNLAIVSLICVFVGLMLISVRLLSWVVRMNRRLAYAQAKNVDLYHEWHVR